MPKSAEIAHGERIAGHAEAIWGWASPAGQQRAQRRAALLVSAAAIGPGKRVLELGCGTGLFTAKFVKAEAQVTALDISRNLLIQAKQRLLAAAFHQADSEFLPYPSGAFDAVVGSSVLHHLPLNSSLGEIARVLRPGGRIAFAEPNMMNPQVMAQKNIPPLKRALGDTPAETAFFRWRLVRQLKWHGFSHATITPFDFLHPLTPPSLIPVVSRLSIVLESLPILREFAGSLLISAVLEPGQEKLL